MGKRGLSWIFLSLSLSLSLSLWTPGISLDRALAVAAPPCVTSEPVNSVSPETRIHAWHNHTRTQRQVPSTRGRKSQDAVRKREQPDRDNDDCGGGNDDDDDDDDDDNSDDDDDDDAPRGSRGVLVGSRDPRSAIHDARSCCRGESRDCRASRVPSLPRESPSSSRGRAGQRAEREEPQRTESASENLPRNERRVFLATRPGRWAGRGGPLDLRSGGGGGRRRLAEGSLGSTRWDATQLRSHVSRCPRTMINGRLLVHRSARLPPLDATAILFGFDTFPSSICHAHLRHPSI